LTIAGGTSNAPSALVIGVDNGSTGTVWLTGGQLNVSNFTIIGDLGLGQMTVSNGTWASVYVSVGVYSGSGTLTIAGGTSTLVSNLAIAYYTPGGVWLTGGQLLVANGSISVGAAGVGWLTQSNGTLQAQAVDIGASAGSQGTLTIAGGTSSVYSNMTIGNSNCSGTGTVVVAGGGLYVTNAAHNAILDVENSTLLLQGGTLVVDQLVTTNPCASFQQTGGIWVVGGVTNAFFRVTAINHEGNNIRITWQTNGGQTNVLQVTNGGSVGGYNANFVDLPPQIIVAGAGLTTTNALDIDGATNTPSRYYRVRLVP
jgi:hypothetical protein